MFPVALTVAVVPLARLFAVYFTDTAEPHSAEKIATILKDCDARGHGRSGDSVMFLVAFIERGESMRALYIPQMCNV